MNNILNVKKSENLNTQVADDLQVVLSSTYGLELMAHNYHWNVEGPSFLSLHKMFEEQYNELFQATDVIAERIRALSAYALPFEGEDILSISKMTSNALNKETDPNLRAERMMLNLMNVHQAVIEKCQTAKSSAKDAEDDETENLMTERITAHQKAVWMLRASLTAH